MRRDTYFERYLDATTSEYRERINPARYYSLSEVQHCLEVARGMTINGQHLAFSQEIRDLPLWYEVDVTMSHERSALGTEVWRFYKQVVEHQ